MAGSIVATPDTIRGQGDVVMLKWNSFGATTVVITPSIGIVPLHGGIQVAPPVTTTYTMTIASETGGHAQGSATVYVVPADPNTPAAVAGTEGVDCIAATQPGTSGALMTDSTSCSLPAGRTVKKALLNYILDDGGSISINGRDVFTKAPGVGPREGTFALPVELFPPNESFSVRVEVRNAVNSDGTLAGDEYGKAVVHLITRNAMAGLEMGVTPGVIRKGDVAHLDWSSVDATALVLNPLVGTVAPRGNLLVSPPQTTTYTPVGWNASGDPATAHLTLKVQ